MTEPKPRKRRADARDMTERIDVMVSPADREAWRRLLAGRLGDIARAAWRREAKAAARPAPPTGALCRCGHARGMHADEAGGFVCCVSDGDGVDCLCMRFRRAREVTAAT